MHICSTVIYASLYRRSTSVESETANMQKINEFTHVYRVLNKFATCKNVIFQLLLWLLILIGCRWLFLYFGYTIIASKWEWTKKNDEKTSVHLDSPRLFIIMMQNCIHYIKVIRCRNEKQPVLVSFFQSLQFLL